MRTNATAGFSARPLCAGDAGRGNRAGQSTAEASTAISTPSSTISGLDLPESRATQSRGLKTPLTSKRNKHAAMKLMRKLLRKCDFVPDQLVTDDLRSYGVAADELGIVSRHERGWWKNCRAENSYQPTRRRKRKIQCFKAPTQPRGLRPQTRPSTTSSTSNTSSHQFKSTERSAQRR
jgi:hypothetical protein